MRRKTLYLFQFVTTIILIIPICFWSNKDKHRKKNE